MIIKSTCSVAVLFAAVCLMMVSTASRASQENTNNDTIIEKGAVNWSNDLEAAKKLSEKTGRPIFLLFQEIPG